MQRTRIHAALLLAAALLAGCIEVGQVIPLDDAAKAIGVPKIELVLHNTAHGAVGITMPDGEILQGEYQLLSNAAFAMEPTPTTIVQKMIGAIIILMSATKAVPSGLSATPTSGQTRPTVAPRTTAAITAR